MTDAADWRLQDALNARAERTTALDVALQGLDDVVRRLRAYIGEPLGGEVYPALGAIVAETEIAFYKAKSYRSQERERLNAGLKARHHEAAENNVLLATQEDARRQADQFAKEIGKLQEELAEKQSELAAAQAEHLGLIGEYERVRAKLKEARGERDDVRRQRNRYHAKLFDVRNDLSEWLDE